RVPQRLVRLIDRQDHRTQKRRLRTGKVVRAIRVEDAAVMFDFKEKVFHHAPSQVDFAGPQQAANDEIAVPAVHLVESSAGNDIGILEEKQAGSSNLIARYLSWSSDNDRKMFHPNIAFP